MSNERGNETSVGVLSLLKEGMATTVARLIRKILLYFCCVYKLTWRGREIRIEALDAGSLLTTKTTSEGDVEGETRTTIFSPIK